MLIMCSASTDRDADLTTRARIRDAAIGYYAEHGFQSTTVRAIAAKARVSPALVIHHFGSKDGLREACDAYVTDRIDEMVREASANLAPRDMLDQLAQIPALAHLSPYVIQALSEGGEFGNRLWERVVQDTESYLRAAVKAGVIRPTADVRTRAEMLAAFKLGPQLLASYLIPRSTAGARVLLIADRFTLPALELFTHGMYTSPDYLDAYLAQTTTIDSTPGPAHSAEGNGTTKREPA
jgi:TetR/AcrR family transcriptional regulator, regulator of cefoperazone and chloramphenicol sensitivity